MTGACFTCKHVHADARLVVRIHVHVYSVGLYVMFMRAYGYVSQQKITEMNGAHLASPIRGELGYAHWPQLGTQFISLLGTQIWGPLGKQDVCPNFALTAVKFLLSNSGNFRAKANPPKPRSCPKRPFGQ